MTADLPFLGRELHLEALADALDAAVEGRRILVAIEGGAGSGKSRLLDELEVRAAVRDVELRRAQAFPTSATQPGAVGDMLGLAELDPTRPAVLLLDDAQWADATSISDLRSLLLHPRDEGLLLTLTHRPVEERDAPNLRRLLEVADRRGDVRRLSLGSLSAAALAGAVGGPDPDAVAERLMADSGGSPLALDELVEQLLASGHLGREGDVLVPTRPVSEWPEPRTVHQRVSELPRDARLLVHSAALASHPIPLAVAVHLLEQDTEEVLDLAERLVDQGFLAESREGFSAPTSTEAEALAADLGAVRRTRTHAALADAMTAAGLDDRRPGLVGTHHLRAGRWEEALSLLSEAGLDAVGRDAYAEALPLVSGALEAVEELRAPDRELEGRLLYARARCHRMLGRSDLAAGDADQAAILLDGEERMRALGWRAQIADDEQQATKGEWLTALAEHEAARLGDHGNLGALLTLRAKMLGRLGMPAEADACLRRGVRLLRIHGDDYRRFLGHWNGAWLAFDRGQATEAESGFEYCAHQARTFTGDEWLAQAEAWHSRALFWSGRAVEAVEAHDRALDAADRTDSIGPAFLSALGRAEGMALFGRYEDARSAADDALDVVLRDIPDWENAVRYARAAALLGEGSVADARREAEQALAACPPGADGERWRKACRALLLEIRAADGDAWPRAEAVTLSRELLEARWFSPAIRLLIARASHEDDDDAARGAAALALELGIPMLAARAVHARGLWDDPVAPEIARAVRETAGRVPDHWREGWDALPEVAPALSREPAGPEERREASTALRRQLETLLGWVALTPSDLRIGPREWTAPLPRPPGERERRRRSVGIVAAVAVLLLAAAGIGIALTSAPDDPVTAADDDQVPMIEADGMVFGSWVLGGGPERTGVAPDERAGIDSFDGLYWVECTGQAVRSSPAVRGQFVYVGSDDEHLHRFNATNGRDRWTRPTDGEIRSSPFVAGGVGGGGLAQRDNIVFVGSDDGSVRAWTIEGDFRWQFRTDGPVESSPIAVDGTVYVGSRDGRLYALSGDAGEFVWQWPAEGEEPVGAIRSSPAVSGDLVYVGSDDGNVYAVDRTSGEERWRHATGGAVRVAPVVSDGVVYVASDDQNVHSVDAENGRPVGMVQYRFDAPLRASPAVADGQLYVANRIYLVAVDIETGSDVWSMPTGREITASPVIAGDYVYVGSTDGTVYAVHRHEGSTPQREPAWTFETGGEITTSPALVTGAVIVGSWDGCVYALGQDAAADPDEVPEEPLDEAPDDGPAEVPGDVPGEPVEDRPDDMPDVDPGEVDLG